MAKGVAVAVKLLIATTNADKRAEITAILDGLPLEIVTLGELPQLGDHEETGASFAENARDKARHYGAVTGLLTVAEDSGLEIDALDGTPGVQSARFNGATYPEKFRVVYEQLAARGAASSPARFVWRACRGSRHRHHLRSAGHRRGRHRTRAARRRRVRLRSHLLLPAVRPDAC